MYVNMFHHIREGKPSYRLFDTSLTGKYIMNYEKLYCVYIIIDPKLTGYQR